MKENTAKNFVIQLGALISLYVSLSALIMLMFGIINVKFPDELAYYATLEGTRESMRVAIAMLVVFFPTYITLTRISNQIRRKEEGGLYTGLTKWLVFLSLLVGGGIILGDLVTILIYFLNGEITSRFIFKAFALLFVVSAAFKYYHLDVRGYFKTNEKKSIEFGAAATLLVVVALTIGYMNIGTPAEVREMKLDDQQTSDLQEIQFRIEEYYRVENTLPANIAELYGDITPPSAPSGREPYRYEMVSDTNYLLCATFVSESPKSSNERPVVIPIYKDNYNWDHGVGEKCFERVVTPAEAID